jgi:hypothetical protein
MRLQRAGFFADGRSIAYSTAASSTAPVGESVLEHRFELIKEDSSRFLFTFPGYVVTRKSGGPAYYQAFGPQTAVAVLNRHFCLGFPVIYAFECRTPSGDPVASVVLTGRSGPPVSSEDRASYLRVSDASNPGPQGAAFRRTFRENVAFASRFPAFGRMVPGVAGELWIGPLTPEGDEPVMRATPDNETLWFVFSVDGEWLADVTLPAGFRLFAADHDRVVGLSRDAFGVESVVVLPLNR